MTSSVREQAVDAFLASAPEPARTEMLRLRALIHRVAKELPRVGQLAESLKWGQPSFTPQKANVGSSVRLAPSADGRVGLYFICHTGLVNRFREIYPQGLVFEGNRAILLTPGGDADRDILAHCIAMALTYHLDRQGTQALRRG